MGSLKGYKTYIVCGLALLAALAGYFDGDMSSKEALEAGFTALAGITLRSGMTTEAGK